jgi:hypothetical protein
MQEGQFLGVPGLQAVPRALASCSPWIWPVSVLRRSEDSPALQCVSALVYSQFHSSVEIANVPLGVISS